MFHQRLLSLLELPFASADHPHAARTIEPHFCDRARRSKGKDPNDLEALKKAVKDAAGKAGGLWLSFNSFATRPASRRHTGRAANRRRDGTASRAAASKLNPGAGLAPYPPKTAPRSGLCR